MTGICQMCIRDRQKCEDLYVETSGEGPVVLPWKQKEIAKE